VRVLVTGASRGIGRAVARRLHADGHALALSARRAEHLEPVLSELVGSEALAADLERSEEAAGLVERAVAALGGLDALVHCAGVVRYASALETSAAELQLQLQVNTVAPFLLSQGAARHMITAGSGGCIVHVASTLGIRPAADTSAYAASKAALISLTRAFALELGPSNIRVNAIAPGLIDTDMIRVVRAPDRASLDPEQTQARIAAQLTELAQLHPLNHLGDPEDVAEAVAYLLTADFISGSVLVLDGGLSLTA